MSEQGLSIFDDGEGDAAAKSAPAQGASSASAGGLPLVGTSPARVGTLDDPLRFARSPGLVDDGPRTEILVALVCDRPAPLSLLARGPVGSSAMKAPPAFRGERDEPLRLAMLTRTYRIGAKDEPFAAVATKIETGS